MDGRAEDRGSRIAGFSKMGQAERLTRVALRTGVGPDELAQLTTGDPLPFPAAEHMVENALGALGLPFGVALNFTINGRDRLIPMAVEEPSIIAAASYAARLARGAGGFLADADPPCMIGQIQLVRVPDLAAATDRVNAAAAELRAMADAVHPNMIRRGGGTRAIEVRQLPSTPAGAMLVVHVVVEVGDAMGANAVNSIVEVLAPRVVELTGGEVRMCILSNLADRRLARASVRLPFEALTTERLPGRTVAERIFEGWAFAAADPYRAATHNKGVMNGIDAVAVATGNDWRGVEAGAHAYAARHGHYGPLTSWTIDGEALVGQIELPLAVATVGGNLEVNRRARLALQILGVRSSGELASIMATVGLAQNFAAVRALVTDGIQRGHMALHARGLAVAAGAREELIPAITERLIASGDIKLAKARELVAAMGAAR
jgi:hydroxymethylglutaryl-CoA reductase